MARPPAVARVLERVTATLRDHAMVVPGESVLVAVSGGPDSLCLLHALVDLRRLFRLELGVFHFDHRLRRGSAEDSAYVGRVASRLGLPFHAAVAETSPQPGASVEDWAHQARYGAFALAMRDAGATRGATGHTRDDQAESVLIGLFRGGGLASVAGIDPVAGPFIRPLIETSRADVEAFCRAKRLRPRLDPTNADTRLLRNAVRRKVLPSLERATGRDLRPTLARTAAILRRDAEELDRQATASVQELVEDDPEGVHVVADGLAALPTAIASRVARAALLRCRIAPTSEDVDAILDLARGRPGRRRDLTGGAAARREPGYLAIVRPGTPGRRG
ncbi:MAG: tRNA lysidine(34) synthetase TilS [Actinomycetota bacterium]